MADNAENGGTPGDAPQPAPIEHLNIKVTDNNNEVFFKIKRNTKLEKLMTAFCERQGKSIQSVRFLFEGQRVQPTDTPDTVRETRFLSPKAPPVEEEAESKQPINRLARHPSGFPPPSLTIRAHTYLPPLCSTCLALTNIFCLFFS